MTVKTDASTARTSLPLITKATITKAYKPSLNAFALYDYQVRLEYSNKG